MTRYVWDKKVGDFVDPKTGERMVIPDRDGVCIPQIIKDIEPHMFGKHYVGSRSAQRELAKKEGYVPYEPVSKYARRMPRSDYDARDDKWQQFMADTKTEVAAKAGLNAKDYEIEMKARKAFGSLRDRIKAREKSKPVV